MNSEKPHVSVIMPCFNAERYVEEAVRSVMGQTQPGIELIVVDDGSTDASADIVSRLAAEFPGRITLEWQSKAGPYPARNRGLSLARGDYVAFLDADDWWSSDCMEKLLRPLLGHADLALTYCGWQNVGDGLRADPYVPPAYEDEDTVADFLRTCPWPIHAALVRRVVVDRLGGFAERRFASMDYDFWLRVLALPHRIKRVPEVLAFYRWHNLGQVSAVRWRQVLDALDAQCEFIRHNPALVAHIPKKRLRDMTEGQVLRLAYRAFWRRDLVSAQKLFRHVAARGSYRLPDIAHVASALLPMPVYRGLVRLAERRHA